MDRPLVAVVLAGGTGTRLYPASRSDHPKQFRAFDGDASLLTRTVDRAGFADDVYVLTRPAYADAVRDHAPRAAVLTEPAPRDTGPALVYAAHRIREQVGECVLVCLPSDHHVGDHDAFGSTLRTAAEVAVDTDGLVTVGVDPGRPATEYGYIEPGDERDASSGRASGDAGTGSNEPDKEEGSDGYHTVASFHEKPDTEVANAYLDAGYYWNAGVFAWTPRALLRAARDSPLAPLVGALADGDPEGGFGAVESVSIDYAVLERTDDAYVVPADFAWDDLGSWDALERLLDADESDNVVLGDALLTDATDCVVATDGHASVVGVSDLVVASFGDRTLVVPTNEAQRVREVVARLRERDLY